MWQICGKELSECLHHKVFYGYHFKSAGVGGMVASSQEVYCALIEGWLPSTKLLVCGENFHHKLRIFLLTDLATKTNLLGWIAQQKHHSGSFEAKEGAPLLYD